MLEDKIGTLAIIGTVMAGLSTGVGILGQQKQAAATAASERYNAQVASNNAVVAKQNADWANQAGETQVAMKQRDTAAKVGTIKAAQAASGVDVNTGSSVDVRSSAAELGQLDAITLRANAARQAYGYNVQGANDMAQSNLDKFAAGNAETAGDINSASTFLGGAGNAATNYAKFKESDSGMTAGGY